MPLLRRVYCALMSLVKELRIFNHDFSPCFQPGIRDLPEIYELKRVRTYFTVLSYLQDKKIPTYFEIIMKTTKHDSKT